MYGVLASGWSLVAYFGHILFDNIQHILISYQKYVVVYILAASAISFAVCYYKGPPSNKRSKDLIKWALQVLGLISIYFSSEFREATIGIIIGSVFVYFFPLEIFGGVRRYWLRKFPPKRKLLTKDEFEDEGRIETEKALKELREYVKSPKCKDQWKLVKKLARPTRFAEFVEGEQHVTLDETVAYDNELHTMEFSDDSSEEIEQDEEEELVVINNSKSKVVHSGGLRPSYIRTPQVTSSTPKGRLLRKRQKTAQNSFEMSDDE